MTPLAHAIVKEMTLPVKRRTFVDQCGLLLGMDDIHCFECSAVIEASIDILKDYARRPDTIGPLAFLPAPKTWLEWSHGGTRIGILLQEHDGLILEHKESNACSIHMAVYNKNTFASSKDNGFLILRDEIATLGHGGYMPLVDSAYHHDVSMAKKANGFFIGRIYALLAMINTPRIIGRTTHMPHAGLQRALAKSRDVGAGKFPLHAWTEIKLKVQPEPKIESGDEELWLTGRRALHFVRCHLRIRLGRLELVNAHWRGDPALGIKQSRYKLVA